MYVSAEARTRGWAISLAPNEARLATALATVELNGLAEWTIDLAEAYPQIVEQVLGEELDAPNAIWAHGACFGTGSRRFIGLGLELFERDAITAPGKSALRDVVILQPVKEVPPGSTVS